MEYIKGLESLNSNEILTDIRYKVFSGRWAGLFFIKNIKTPPSKYDYLYNAQISNYLKDNIFNNPFFMWLPQNGTRKGVFYKSKINEWTNLLFENLYVYSKDYKYKKIREKNIFTLNQGEGTFICKDVSVLQSFLYWKKFRILVWNGKFNRNSKEEIQELLNSCLKEARKLLLKFKWFIVVTNDKGSEDHILFDDIFLISRGDHYADECVEDKYIIYSGVMK